jgi:prepilin-type N-terminal cleavage/methylation domain-containing protein
VNLMKTGHDARGFSLIELLVVIGVLGLLVAITVPGISGFAGSVRVSGAANTLAADLRYARALASAQRKTYAVTFEASNYSVVRLSPAATVRTRALPRGVACAASDTATFFPWGLTTPTTITVSGNGRSNVVRLTANGSVSHD